MTGVKTKVIPMILNSVDFHLLNKVQDEISIIILNDKDITDTFIIKEKGYFHKRYKVVNIQYYLFQTIVIGQEMTLLERIINFLKGNH
jgi:hypothetical protein